MFRLGLIIGIVCHEHTQISHFDTSFTIPIVLLRAYVSTEDKLKYSNAVPSWFDEIICGLILGDGNLRVNGNHAQLSVQQVHPEIVNNLWNHCFSLHLVIKPVNTLVRGSKQVVYYFQTLTLPYFTRIQFNWYSVINGKTIKTLPDNVTALLTPLALAHWVMGDGSFDGYGGGIGRVTLFTNNFTHAEVGHLRNILQSKYGIESAIRLTKHSDPNRGHAIRVPAKSLNTLRSLCVPHMYPSLIYKLGL